MLKDVRDDATQTNEKGNLQVEMPNFRVYGADGYGLPVTKCDFPPKVVYVLVSLFNSHFVRQAFVSHMLKETDETFSTQDTVSPIFYINTRKLQEITEPILFPIKEEKAKVNRSRQGPVHNAERSWLDCFRKAELAQHKQGVTNVKRHILQWEIFLKMENVFNEIHKFIKELFSVPALVENDFKDQILEVISLFASHNAKKFKKEHGEVDLSDDEDQLLREYLVQEFSVFLLLASLNTLQQLQEAYFDAGVNISVSITETTVIQPVLTYPISAGGELAEKTFSLFLKMQSHYMAECSRRGLPIITSPLVIVDSFISNEKRVAANISSISQVTAAASSSSEHSGDNVKNLSNIEENPGSAEEMMYVQGSLSAAQSSAQFKQSEVDRITDKIMDMILNHQKTGEEGVELSHKNGICCDVHVKGKIEGYIPTSINDCKAQEHALRIRIKDAVQSTWATNLEEKRKFTFAGYRFELKTSKPEPLSYKPQLK